MTSDYKNYTAILYYISLCGNSYIKFYYKLIDLFDL